MSATIHLRRPAILLACLLAAAVLLQSCAPAADIPAPHLVQADREVGLTNAGVIDELTYTLGWTTDAPLVAGEDIIILEVLDGSGAVAYSATFSHAETSIRFNALTGPEGRIESPGAIRDLILVCGQTYSWHVRQMRGLQASPWSEEWTFTASPRQAPISLMSPADGAEVSSGALQWDHGRLYTGYAEIRLGEAPTDALVPQRSPSIYAMGPLEVQTFYNLIPGQRYYWSVRKMSHYGCPGAWSPWWSFIWTGPPITGSPSGTLNGGLPAGFSLEPPPPICPLGECATQAPATPTAAAVLTGEPLLPTAEVILPTRTPPPTAVFTLPPPTCSSYESQGKCEANGCYWWSQDYCKPIPEPTAVPACSTHKNEKDCEQAQCIWEKDICH